MQIVTVTDGVAVSNSTRQNHRNSIQTNWPVRVAASHGQQANLFLITHLIPASNKIV